MLRRLKRAFSADRTPSPTTVPQSLEERLASVRYMSGSQFEHFMADVMRGLGYQVRVLGGSGDQGVDVIAQRGGERIAIQCKQYDRPVGNKPIQEVFAGARHHRCTKAIVAAPAGFTKAAVTLARSTGVLLYDAAVIKLEIQKIDTAPGEPPAAAPDMMHGTAPGRIKLEMQYTAPPTLRRGATPRSIDTAKDRAMAAGKGIKRHTVWVGPSNLGTTTVGEEVSFAAELMGTAHLNNSPGMSYTFYRLPDGTFRVLCRGLGKSGRTISMLVPSDMPEAMEHGQRNGFRYGRMTLEEMLAHSFDFGTAYKGMAEKYPDRDWGL
jgi:hypothetical protein